MHKSRNLHRKVGFTCLSWLFVQLSSTIKILSPLGASWAVNFVHMHWEYLSVHNFWTFVPSIEGMENETSISWPLHKIKSTCAWCSGLRNWWFNFHSFNWRNEVYKFKMHDRLPKPTFLVVGGVHNVICVGGVRTFYSSELPLTQE